MILDEQSAERSALYALEMLEGDERERFERDARINPELSACTAEFRDLAADVAVAATPMLEPPPLAVLTGALERIGAVGPAGSAAPAASHKWSRLRWPARSGVLAACAALALLIGGGVTVLKLVSGGGGDSAGVAAVSSGVDAGEDEVVVMKNGETLAIFKASDRRLDQMIERMKRMETMRGNPEVIQNIARLEDKLNSLRKVDAALHTPGPRKAVRLYFEMVVPGTETTEEIPLTERVDAVDYEVGQAGTGGGSEPVEKDEETVDPIILRPEDSGEIPDVNPSEDRPVYFYDLPTGHDRFEPIDDGRLWDAQNNRIWVETAQPGVYQALAPPSGDDFDPDLMEDHPDFPAGGSLPAPPAQDEVIGDNPEIVEVVEPLVEAEIGAEPAVPEPPQPVAVTSYEQTTGRGVVMISNLPPAGEGEVYHFWMRNAADEQEVNIGKLLLEDGSEHFEFDLLGPGITPSGFFITLETEDEVDSPSETIILEGP